jgi:hypothetical protein
LRLCFCANPHHTHPRAGFFAARVGDGLPESFDHFRADLAFSSALGPRDGGSAAKTAFPGHRS